MTVKLLTAPHLRFLSFLGGCTGLSESTLLKMPHCWKSRVTAHIVLEQTHTVAGINVLNKYIMQRSMRNEHISKSNDSSQ